MNDQDHDQRLWREFDRLANMMVVLMLMALFALALSVGAIAGVMQ